jgi:hypothetical protein
VDYSNRSPRFSFGLTILEPSMSAAVAQILLLVQHFAAILQTFGDKAVPVATLALKFITTASPFVSGLFPAAVPFLDGAVVALNLIIQHGPEVAADLENVFKLLGSIEGLKPKLEAAAATPALTSPVSQ